MSQTFPRIILSTLQACISSLHFHRDPIQLGSRFTFWGHQPRVTLVWNSMAFGRVGVLCTVDVVATCHHSLHSSIDPFPHTFAPVQDPRCCTKLPTNSGISLGNRYCLWHSALISFPITSRHWRCKRPSSLSRRSCTPVYFTPQIA